MKYLQFLNLKRNDMSSKYSFKSQSSPSILTIILCIVLGSIISFGAYYYSQGYFGYTSAFRSPISTDIIQNEFRFNAFEPLGKSPPPLGSIRVDSTTQSSLYGGNGDKQHLGGWTGNIIIELLKIYYISLINM